MTILYDLAMRVGHWLKSNRVPDWEKIKIVIEVPRQARDGSRIYDLEKAMLQDITPAHAHAIEAIPGDRDCVGFKTCGMTIEFRRAGSGRRKIKTSYDFPPIPDRRFDWSAARDGYDTGDPVGHGRSQAEAIGELIMLEGDLV